MGIGVPGAADCGLTGVQQERRGPIEIGLSTRPHPSI